VSLASPRIDAPLSERADLLRGLGLLADVRLPFACGTPGSAVVAFSESIAFLLIVFLLDRVAFVTFIALNGRNSKSNLQRLG
jgi:hypothetical protein